MSLFIHHRGKCRAENFRRPASRRGSAVVAILIVLVTLQFIVLGVVVSGSRDQNSTLARIQGLQAFYAAEGLTNMAVRELFVSADEDGDGKIGGVSDDNNSSNNPAINGATGLVAMTSSGSTTTLTTSVSNATARRKIVVNLSN